MGPVNAAKIAAEAEVIRFQAMAKRQGIRAVFGILTVIFALGMLALLNAVVYELLRFYLQPLFASLIVLLIDLAIAAGLGSLAIWSSPSQTEQDALEVRRRAIHDFEGSLAMSALLPVAGSLARSDRQARPRWWLFTWRRR